MYGNVETLSHENGIYNMARPIFEKMSLKQLLELEAPRCKAQSFRPVSANEEKSRRPWQNWPRSTGSKLQELMGGRGKGGGLSCSQVRQSPGPIADLDWTWSQAQLAGCQAEEGGEHGGLCDLVAATVGPNEGSLGVSRNQQRTLRLGKNLEGSPPPPKILASNGMIPPRDSQCIWCVPNRCGPRSMRAATAGLTPSRNII